jgi:transcriptional regulator with XRE-family HTH domain
VPKLRQSRKTRPFVARAFAPPPPGPDEERVHAGLLELPLRVQRANEAGPRYNQSELAKRSGLSQSVISKLANSANLYGVRLDTVYRLAGALGVSVCALLADGEPPSRGAAARRQPRKTTPRKKRPAR